MVLLIKFGKTQKNKNYVGSIELPIFILQGFNISRLFLKSYCGVLKHRFVSFDDRRSNNFTAFHVVKFDKLPGKCRIRQFD